MSASAGENPAREQIVRLGHALVAEQRRDYDDCAHADGLAGFLVAWRADADAALGHEAVRVTLVALAERKGCDLPDLTLADMQAVHAGIRADVFGVLGVENSVRSRRSYGGTAPDQVRAQVAAWQDRLGQAGA